MFLLKLFKVTDKKYLNAISQAGTIGLHMVSGIVVGSLIGYGLDSWLDSSPKCLLIFMAVGIVAGFKNVYVDTKRLVERLKREDEEHFGSPAQGAASPESGDQENSPGKDKGGNGKRAD